MQQQQNQKRALFLSTMTPTNRILNNRSGLSTLVMNRLFQLKKPGKLNYSRRHGLITLQTRKYTSNWIIQHHTLLEIC